MKRKTYIAEFSNGTTIKRQTVNRTYTHAYLKIIELTEPKRDEAKERAWSGFSSSRQQAGKNMESESAWTNRMPHKVIIAEIVKVELQL